MERKHEVRVTGDTLVRDGWKLAAFTTLVLMLMLVLAGCAHQKAYKRGDRLSREGQYDQAVQELEKAIRLAEDDDNHKAAQKYREKLSQVRVQAGQFFHREAELHFGRAELGEARDSIVRALTFCPQEPTYESFRQRVLQAITEAEKVRADALSLAEQRQWPAAIQRMNEALAMYRTLPGGEGDLKHIRERAYQYYVDRANDRLREGNLAEAESEAQTAMTYLAGSEAKAVIQTVKNRREAAELVARGRALLDQGDPEGALAALERAARLHPSHPDLADLLNRAKHAVCDRWLDQGRTALAAHNYPAAMRLFQKSCGLLDGYGGVNTLLADARSALAELHLKASRQFLLAEAAGSAAFHAAAAVSYLPASTDAHNQLGECIDQVRRDVSYAVAFAGFKATTAQQSPAAILDAAALEHLARSHPTNVTVMQRPDLQTVFGERDLDAIEQIDPQSSELQGVDALIVGQVLSAKVTSENKRSGYGESIYQDGFRPEPNPEHGQAAAALHAAMEQLEHARIRLSEAEDRLSHFRYVDPHDPRELAAYRRARAQVDEARHHLEAAAAEVGVAKVRLAATPREVLVPNMVKHQYPIETFTWTARIACLIKMLDTTTGEVFIVQRADGQAEQSDTMVQADAYRNVPEDPLVLPSEFGLLEAAANAAFAKLKPTLSQACTKHGQRFLLTMQRADASGDAIRAVDNGVKYLFAYPAGDGHTGAIVDSLRKYLADEDGLIDVRAMLRTHCHVLQ